MLFNGCSKQETHKLHKPLYDKVLDKKQDTLYKGHILS